MLKCECFPFGVPGLPFHPLKSLPAISLTPSEPVSPGKGLWSWKLVEKWSPWNKLSVLIMDLLRSLLMWAEAGSPISSPSSSSDPLAVQEEHCSCGTGGHHGKQAVQILCVCLRNFYKSISNRTSVKPALVLCVEENFGSL